MLQRGDSLGPYELIANIGNGSSGNVWRAKRREGLGPELAIKILNGNNTSKETFQHEANIWIQLGFHPNIMQIIDTSVYNDHYVIVSFYTSEGSLESWLKNNNGRAPSEQMAIELILGILQGLAHLHKNKIIHSDLAPKNILLQGGIPRLIDFGVSKIFTSTRGTVEGTSGTPIYMAPEVYQGEISRRSDIWSVGVIFYQLVCGQLPFESEKYGELLKKIFLDPITPLPANVSKPIQNIIYRALEKDRKDRFQTAEAMIKDLKEAINLPYVAPLPQTLPVIVKSAPSKSTFSNYLNYFLLLVLIPSIYFSYQYWSQSPLPNNFNNNPNNLTNNLNTTNNSTVSSSILPPLKEFRDYMTRASTNHQQGKLDLALADYNQAIQLAPNDATAYNNRGGIYIQQGKVNLGLTDFNKAIQLAPTYAMVYYNRGNVYKDQNKLDLALADFNTVINFDSQDLDSYEKRGQVYYDQHKLNLALADFNTVIKLDTERVDAYFHRGLVYDKQGQLDQALADFNKALQLDPTYVDAYFNRGLLHKKRNNKAQAIADFQKAKSLYQDPLIINFCVDQLRSLGVKE
jgi:serine/threonine protein kinase